MESEMNWPMLVAQTNMDRAATETTNQAAQSGVALTVKTDVYLNDGSANWATVLATILCESPSLATGTRDAMAKLITQALNLAKPFGPDRLSKRLSRTAHKLVCMILNNHGYDCTTLTNGLSIRNIVKNNLRHDTEAGSESDTKFYADRIELNGKPYRYKQRERASTGSPWNDFCIRLAGHDTPLAVVLKLRNIGVNQFRSADEKALLLAGAEELTRRQTISRQGQIAPSLAKLQQTIERLLKPGSAEEFKGTAVALHARLWWQELSPARQQTEGFWDMARTLRDDPLARSAAQAWIDKPATAGA